MNKSLYQVNIENMQNALKKIASNPNARLEIEPEHVALIISGKYARIVRGTKAVAKVLVHTVNRYVDSIEDAPIEPVLDVNEQIVSVEIPFAYRDATGRIFQRDEGWGGEFTFKNLQVKLQGQFDGPVMVESELIAAVDSLCNPFLAPDTYLEEDMEKFTEEDRDEDMEEDS